jgi:AmiR/NasT family two-component response regulator
MTESLGRILVVDDNRMNRIKLSRSLEVEGYEAVDEAVADHRVRAPGINAPPSHGHTSRWSPEDFRGRARLPP